MSKKNFSIFDDPSFTDYNKKDWEEWRKNNKNRGVPPSICVGCLNQLEDGSCEIFDRSEQRAVIIRGECEERFD